MIAEKVKKTPVSKKRQKFSDSELNMPEEQLNGDTTIAEEKPVKNAKKPKKRKLAENVVKNMPEESLNGDISEPAITVSKNTKKIKKFSAKEFRNALNDPRQAHASVKEFVLLCKQETGNDPAMEFVGSGGSLIEILQLLDGNDKKNLGYAAPILEAATIILLKIQSSAPHLITQADEACRYLLNNYTITIHAMFQSHGTPSQRRVALKLLTSIVTLSGVLGKEILLQIDFTSEILALVSQQTDGNTSNSVRTAWIHFLLSFIVEGHISLIRALLEKKDLLGSMFLEMIYDDASLVNLVLTALKTNIVQNMLVSKTLKLGVFNKGTLKSLVNLYNWKGRNFWKVKIKKKVKGDVEIDAGDKEIVMKDVHDFLLLLCTSRKFGLVFHNQTLLKKDCNHVLDAVLKCLDRPWEHKYPCELVLKIASAAPDLVKSILGTVENYLEPRSSVTFLNAVSFLKNLITSVNFELIEKDLKILSPDQLKLVVGNLCIPNVIMAGFITNKTVIHGDPYLREVYIDLLCGIFKNYVNFVGKVNWINFQALGEYLVHLGPTVGSLIKAWGMNDNKEVYSESREVFGDYLKDFDIKIGILELFGYYHRLEPKSLQNLEFTPETFLKENEVPSKILFKISELFLQMDSNVFSPENSYFQKYMEQLLGNVDLDNIKILEEIFKSLKIFQGNEKEILIWLEVFLYGNGLQKVLPQALKNAELNSDSISPILSAILDMELEKNEWKYLNVVICNIFHTLNVLDFVPFLDKLHPKYCKHLISYIKSWENSPECLSEKLIISEELSVLTQLSNILILDLEIPGDLFAEQLSKFVLLDTFQMILFYFTQMINNNSITVPKIDKILILLEKLYELIEPKVRIFEIIYYNQILRKYFNPLCLKSTESEKNLNYFIVKITKSINPPKLYLNYFEEKLLSSYYSGIKKSTKNVSLNIEEFSTLTELLEIEFSACCKIISKIPNISSDILIYNQKLSIFAYFLTYSLKQIVKLYKTGLELIPTPEFGNILSLISSSYSLEIDTDLLNHSLLNFIIKFPHYTQEVDTNFIKALIEKKVFSKIDAKFLSHLIQHKKYLKIVTNTEDIHKNKLLIIPLLDVLLSKKFNAKLIYDEYEFLINKTIEKPHKIGAIIHENASGITKLIANYMPVETCNKIANKIHKFDVVLDFHIKILETIYNKAIESNPNQTYINNYVQTLLNLSINPFKHENLDQIQIICKYLQSFLIKHQITELFKRNENIFIKNCLKYGMKNVPNAHVYLETLRVLITKTQIEEIATIYEMIISHSEFLNITLSQTTQQKTELLKIILQLIQLKPEILSTKLIPILLGGYFATTSCSDQTILTILYQYEINNISLEEFKPFIWGELAVTQYSIRQNLKYNLQRQPNTSQILELFDIAVIHNTLINFDPKHSLTVLDLPELESSKGVVSKYVDFYTEQKRLVIENKNNIGVVYDLNFCLPLFSDLLSSNSLIKCYKFTRRGCLALVLLGLGSECNIIRQAAYNVLARFYFHLEADRRLTDPKLWIEFINRIRGGILKLCKNDKDLDITKVRLPYISTIFLARSALIMSQPLNPLYQPINNFIFLKPEIDFTTIPEFLQLFHSSDVDYKLHRNWVLQNIRDGIKSNLDLYMINNTVAFKMLLSFYFSKLCNPQSKKLILEIIERACLIPKFVKYLLFELSLTSWLTGAVNSELESEQVEIVLEIVNNLCKATETYTSEKSILHEQFLLLLLKISNIGINFRNYGLFIKLLVNATNSAKFKEIPRSAVVKIIELGENCVQGNDCYYMLDYGAKYVSKIEISGDADVNVKNYLRLFISQWVNSQ